MDTTLVEKIHKFIKLNPHISIITISEELGIKDATGFMGPLVSGGKVTRIKDFHTYPDGTKRRMWHYTAIPQKPVSEFVGDLFNDQIPVNAMAQGASLIGAISTTPPTGINLPVIDVPQIDVKRQSSTAVKFDIESMTLAELRRIYAQLKPIFDPA